MNPTLNWINNNKNSRICGNVILGVFSGNVVLFAATGSRRPGLSPVDGEEGGGGGMTEGGGGVRTLISESTVPHCEGDAVGNK